MFSIEDLRFAVRFPFSNLAKQVLRLHAFPLDKTPPLVLAKAASLIVFSAQPKKQSELEEYFKKRIIGSSDLLLQEIQAFPIAKILVSAMDKPEFCDRLSDLVAKQVFFYLTLEEKRELLFSLSHELNARAAISRKPGFFAEVSLIDFLQANFSEDFLKLVNQPLEEGVICLSQNDFARFLSEYSREQTRASLPVPLDGVPKGFSVAAKKLGDELAFRKTQSFQFQPLGNVEAQAFPPCMAKIYSELLSGQRPTHSARFNLATFLAAVGMPSAEIVEVFSHASNFNEKITRYQVERIVGKGKPAYSPSSCAKMREYELCVANCPVKHPLQFYRIHKANPASSESETDATSKSELKAQGS